jgi:hypothetical protein
MGILTASSRAFASVARFLRVSLGFLPEGAVKA